MLTKEEIRMVLKLLAQEVVASPTELFPYTISRTTSGYSTVLVTAQLQAKLSVMLEAARG